MTARVDEMEGRGRAGAHTLLTVGEEAKQHDADRETRFVSFVLERWLHAAPNGPLELGSEQADRATAALARAWSSTLVHAFAARPHTLPALRQTVPIADPHALDDQIAALEAASLAEPRLGAGEGTRYAPTDWLRQAIAPLTAAARLERLRPGPERPPIDRLDVEAAFMLALPLMRPPAELRGSAHLAVAIRERDPYPAGATVQVECGRVVSCRRGPRGVATCRTVGSVPAWLDAVIEADAGGLEIDGDEELGAALLGGLHEVLFGVPVRSG